MSIVGLDCGRKSVKVFTGQKMFNFASIVGEARERNLNNRHSNGDLEVEFESEKFYVGELAERESEFYRAMMTEQKDHDDTRLLALTALHQANVTEARVITGLPVANHNDENKKRLKQLLQGRWEITVNGERKIIIIKSVDVAAEGGAAFWSRPTDGIVRVIDGGSKTINYVTLKDRRYVDRESGTLDFGFETNKSTNDKQLIARIAGELGKKWGNKDLIWTAGGKALDIAKYIEPYFKNAIPMDNALYANAIGFHAIGRIIHNV